MRRYALSLLLTAALVLSVTACGTAMAPARPLVTPGEKVADMTLFSLDGQETPISSVIRDRVALVDVWATWCAPCVAAMPELQALHNRFKDRGFTVVGVMTDSNAKRIGAEWVKESGVTYPMLIDEDGTTFQSTWGQVAGIPLLVLVDREGTVIETYRGTVGVAALESKLEAVFGVGGPASPEAPATGETPEADPVAEPTAQAADPAA